MTELDLKTYLDEKFRDIKDDLREIKSCQDEHSDRLTSVERDASFLQAGITDLIVRKDAEHNRLWSGLDDFKREVDSKFDKCKVDGQKQLDDKLKNTVKNSTATSLKWAAGIIITLLLATIVFLANNFVVPSFPTKQEHKTR